LELSNKKIKSFKKINMSNISQYNNIWNSIPKIPRLTNLFLDSIITMSLRGDNVYENM